MNQGVVRGSYLTDLLGQPAALASLRTELAAKPLPASVVNGISSRHFRRVLLTGMGSSLHSLYPTFRRMGKMRVDVQHIETAELLTGFDALFDRATLLIAVSQSGESAEIAELLKRSDQFGHVIGVTNGPASTLARKATTKILIAAGSETSVSCKTYVCTLAALHWMQTQIEGGDASAAINDILTTEQAVADYLANWSDHVRDWMPWVDHTKAVFVTGRADSLATAMTGGLILKEATRQPAEGMSCAAFRHGPMEMADESVLVVIFEGEGADSELNRRLADDIRAGGGKAMLVRQQKSTLVEMLIASVPVQLRPIAEILLIQMLSLAIASRDGIEAGRFQRASKITIIA